MGNKHLDLNNWPYIWCDNCGIQPLLVDQLPAGKQKIGTAEIFNAHKAMDLICYNCKLVITTLHENDKN